MKIETLLNIALFLVIFASLTISFTLGYIFNSLTFSGITGEMKTNYTNCSNLSIEDTSECLTQEVRGFYNYNITQIGKKISLEELKESGGVCSHYADYLSKRGNELGFQTTRISFELNETYAHAITILANESMYCMIDQNVYSCWRLG